MGENKCKTEQSRKLFKMKNNVAIEIFLLGWVIGCRDCRREQINDNLECLKKTKRFIGFVSESFKWIVIMGFDSRVIDELKSALAVAVLLDNSLSSLGSDFYCV